MTAPYVKKSLQLSHKVQPLARDVQSWYMHSSTAVMSKTSMISYSF